MRVVGGGGAWVDARRGVVRGREFLGAGDVLVGECGVGACYAEGLCVLVLGEGAVGFGRLGGEGVGGDGAGVFGDGGAVGVVDLGWLVRGVVAIMGFVKVELEVVV